MLRKLFIQCRERVTSILSRLIMVVARAEDNAMNLEILVAVTLMLKLLCSGSAECNKLAQFVMEKLKERLGTTDGEDEAYGPLLKGAFAKSGQNAANVKHLEFLNEILLIEPDPKHSILSLVNTHRFFSALVPNTQITDITPNSLALVPKTN